MLVLHRPPVVFSVFYRSCIAGECYFLHELSQQHGKHYEYIYQSPEAGNAKALRKAASTSFRPFFLDIPEAASAHRVLRGAELRTRRSSHASVCASDVGLEHRPQVRERDVYEGGGGKLHFGAHAERGSEDEGE